jgi:biotin synthase
MSGPGTNDWNRLTERALRGEGVTPAEALAVLESHDDALLDAVAAAFRVRLRYFGRGVRLHVIQNARSGACSEDCAFCSQSAVATTEIPQYPLQSLDDIVAGAAEAARLHARRYCIVTSGRAPTEQDLERLCQAVKTIKQRHTLEICTSLGLLTDEQARRLKRAGVDRYNHNLETSARYFPAICSAHRHTDRRETARRAKRAGLDLCSGGLIGMGETLQDRVDLAFALRDVGADSIPVNFLHPRPGTPLEGRAPLTPAECLRTLVMFRFVHPDREIRLAGGRETCVRHLQPLALFVVNSIFTQGYLTTGGQGYERDRAMIEEAGFFVEAVEA